MVSAGVQLSLRQRLEAILTGGTVPPMHVEIHPTDFCNHRCIWCVAYEDRKKGVEIPLQRMLPLLSELRHAGVQSVLFSGGGDPLYYPYIAMTLYHAKSIGLRTSIVTNGGNLGPDIRRCLLRTVQDYIRFSLDAGTPGAHRLSHRPAANQPDDEFETIFSNISALIQERGRSRGPRIGRSFILHPKNLEGLSSFLGRARKLQVDFIHIKRNYLLSPALNDKLIAQARPIVQLFKQKAPEIHIKIQHFSPRKGLPQVISEQPGWFLLDLDAVIAADCKVYPCCHLITPVYCEGDVSWMSFDTMWYSKERAKWRHNLITRGFACRVCSEKKLEKNAPRNGGRATEATTKLFKKI